jgi:hypothetical protein
MIEMNTEENEKSEYNLISFSKYHDGRFASCLLVPRAMHFTEEQYAEQPKFWPPQ